MKRLHIVGKSKDNRRLYLARARDAKFGSFEIPIGRKLLRLIEEVQAARRPKRKRAGPEPKVPPAPEPDLAGVRVIPTEGAVDESPPPAAPAAAGGPEERSVAAAAGPREPRGEEPPQVGLAGATSEKPAPEPGPAPEPPPRPEPQPAPEPPPRPEPRPAEEPPSAAEQSEPEEPATEGPPRRETWIHAREERVEIPARSNLTPAEIQALIRSGRGVRAVARLAGTPLAWIRYLAEPIRQERQGVVDQLLRARQTRARLGPSSETIGESVYQNLRGKGIRSPDRILEDGFSAHRSDDGQWRVRLFFEHRGKRYSARWSFDPQTREVIPQNTLSVQMGWRRPRGADESDEEPVRRRPVPRRTTTPRGRAAAPSRKKPVARKKTAAARKRTTRTSSTARRKTATGRTTSARARR